jgi:hypothetical protein
VAGDGEGDGCGDGDSEGPTDGAAEDDATGLDPVVEGAGLWGSGLGDAGVAQAPTTTARAQARTMVRTVDSLAQIR